jgi:predicted glycogen debranching enzyme
MATSLPFAGSAEWLEADGLGGFASGTVNTIRTRRYHGVLVASLRPPTDRVVLVNGLDIWAETAFGNHALASQRYIPDVVHPDGVRRIVDFATDPWPRWTFRLEDGTEIIHEITVPRDQPVALLTWRLSGSPTTPPPESVRLLVRPLLSCRDAHSLHQANPSFRFDADEDGEMVRWHPYHGIPGVVALSNAEYRHNPVWYHGFLYSAERERGLDCTEDLASPGAFHWDLAQGEACLVLTTDSSDVPLVGSAPALLYDLRSAERLRREKLGSRLLHSAEAFLVRRGTGRSILAGYPWSTDWGRDTFVALRGLCLATGRLDEARQILLGWADYVTQGLLPNFFPDRPDEPAFNSADASLWYIIAVYDFLQAMTAAGRTLPTADCTALRRSVGAILTSYIAGTRFGIQIGDDGLLAAGEAGTPLTWMDARLGEWSVTPRVGKAVEIQALWLNALRIGAMYSPRWQAVLERGSGAFLERFWNERESYLFDVVDLDHRPGVVDPTFRPNQILAVGGLPFPLIGGLYARRIVDEVEARLWTPLGLRTLPADDPAFIGRCDGNVRQRLARSHQGAAWPWLLGPFVEAWVRVRGDTEEAKRQARTRFLVPILRHLDEAGLGHVSELADGSAPHTPRGSPFQAWSLGEVLRLSLQVLATDAPAGSREPQSTFVHI